VPQDYAQAARWYRKAADQGYAKAQYNLGILYGTGKGATQDYAEAANWSRKAADQGDPVGQAFLGRFYLSGQGVPTDYVQADMWLTLALSRPSTADQVQTEQAGKDNKSDALATKLRDYIEGIMTEDQIAEAHRLAREWKPK
jgi:TPR repeat protein